MATLTFTIPNLTNGVSQQPDTVRLPNQGEEQINANCRVTDGLSKRNPLHSLFTRVSYKDVVGDPVQNTYDRNSNVFHMIKGKDAVGDEVTAQFMVDTLTGSLYVIYVEGPRQGQVELIDTFPYLSNSVYKDIKFLTNGDTTYILNKNTKVTLGGTANTTTKLVNKQGSLLYIQQGYFGTNYKVDLKLYDEFGLVSSISANTSTPNSTTADVSSLQTSTITSALVTAINSARTTAGGDWTAEVSVTSSNNWIQIKLDDDTFAETHYIVAETFSSTARTALYAFNGVCLDISALPPTAPSGYTLRVVIDSESVEDDYYLSYQNKELGWIETKQLGINTTITSTTLPIVLTGYLDDYTTASAAHLVLKDREVGDIISCPEPSFVGFEINDMFIFSNRLGFLSRNNVIMSKIDEYDMFYRTTMVTSLSSDRVDLTAAVPTTRYSDLNFSVPFDKELVLFGDAAQYSLSSNTGFDVRTANLATLTEYESSKEVQPLNIGSSIYFPIVRGAYSAIFDLARRTDVGLTAEEVTQHVPIYIKGGIVQMVHSATENMVFIRTGSQAKTIYVQNRFVRDAVVQQNAWHKWEFTQDILHINVIGSKLYVTTTDATNTYFTVGFIDISLSLITQDNTTNISFTPYLDMIKLIPQGSTVYDVYFVGTPYMVTPDIASNLKGITPNGSIISGLAAINEALVNDDIWIGIPYQFKYVFSKQQPASFSQDGKMVMQYAKLTLQSMKVSYQKTSKFTFKIKPTARQEYEAKFTGNLLGVEGSILGRTNLYSGVFKFPINVRAEEVTISVESSEPYPVTLNTVEWAGKLNNNLGRM